MAEELDLSPNDRIIRVNGGPMRDYLDFRFQTTVATSQNLEYTPLDSLLDLKSASAG